MTTGAKFKEKVKALCVTAVALCIFVGGYMLAYGWSSQVMVIGRALLSAGVVGVVAIIWGVAIKNFGPLQLPQKPDRE